MDHNITDNPVATTNPIMPQKKPKSFWKSCFIVIGILALIIIAVVAIQIIRIKTAKDIAPIDDSDLRLSVINIADADNAYIDLIKIKEVYTPKGDVVTKLLDGSAWDDAQAKDIVDKNRENLSYFEQALQKPKYQDPAYADPAKVTFDTVSAGLGQIRSISRVRLLQAEIDSRAKDSKALDKAISVGELGQRMQQSQGPLITFLVTMALKTISLNEVERIVKSGNIAPSEIKNYITRVENIKSSRPGWETARKYEYVIMANTNDNLMAEALAEDPDLGAQIKAAVGQEGLVKLMNSNFYFQKNSTQKLYAEWAREEISLSGKSCEDNNYEAKESQGNLSPITLIFKENAVGYIFYNITSVSLSGVVKKVCNQEVLAEKVILEMKNVK